MKKFAIFAGAVALGATFMCTSARAQYPSIQNGNGLYALCTADDPTEKLLCMTFVIGASDAYRVSYGADKNRGLCVPSGVSNKQMTDLVTVYLRDHPQIRDELSVGLVLRAMTETWRCNG